LADSGAVAGLATAATLAAQPAHADHSRPAVETIASATPTAKPGGAAAGSPDAPLPTPADRAGPPGSQLPDPNGLSQADRVRFVQRVAEAFRGVGDEGGTVRLRLSPPELGSLRIDITVRKGEMTARVETETPAARNLLLDNLPALRDRLAQHDIKVQRFDVDFTDRWADQSHDPASQYQDPATYRNPASQPTQVPAGAEAEAPPALGLIAAGQPPRGGRLNIVI
jgi:flagellar hook-length control protein FliK